MSSAFPQWKFPEAAAPHVTPHINGTHVTGFINCNRNRHFDSVSVAPLIPSNCRTSPLPSSLVVFVPPPVLPSASVHIRARPRQLITLADLAAVNPCLQNVDLPTFVDVPQESALGAKATSITQSVLLFLGCQ